MSLAQPKLLKIAHRLGWVLDLGWVVPLGLAALFDRGCAAVSKAVRLAPLWT
jgi:hypothetical protein